MPTEPLEPKVLEEIPEEFVERYERLLGAPLLPPEQASQRLGRYLSQVLQVATLMPRIDGPMAERLVKILVPLHATHPEEPVVNAAVRYFLEEDDDDEITGVLGFDDDRAVIRAVLQALGDDELLTVLVAG